ncbi:MAG TPA: Gfo/Idh/MocA family oxidoreductase [Luteolibacter sp.]|nr:Gfo/Idh/MocA family oxidoreductase [Luteolibacter sp.]
MHISPLPSLGRRRFLATAGSFAAGAMLLRGQDVAGANERIRVGLIGCGERGNSLIKQLKSTPGTQLVAVCDPDTDHMAKAAGVWDGKPEKIRDYRKLLERKDIDAVIIASPNFWHALHTIHAVQAGKDVYVEKPVTHDIWSGRQVEAAIRQTGRIVQAGTQNRSDTGLKEALKYIQSGEIGAIKAVRGLCYRNRNSIGKVAAPIKPPETLDYDLWLGPAQDLPILRPHLHYDWHWVYNTGDGDIGNQGPHELDLISWFLGDPGLPASMFSFGGRYGWDDAGETANMQVASFSLAGVPCLFEVNNMWLAPKRNAAAVYQGIRVGILVTCEKGEFRGGRGGGFVVGPDGATKIAKFPGDAGGGHMINFFNAVRSRRSGDLAAPIVNSHRSAALAHLANISLRTGRKVPLEKLATEVPQQEALTEVVGRQNAQLKDWNLDFASTCASLGTTLAIDPATGIISGPENAAVFNQPQYRKGYEIPKIV